MKFLVNGEAYSLEPASGEMLSEVLRDRLGLTGTKIGCDEAECGTCTVLLDGEPVLACTVPAPKVEGRRIRTIEGLAEDGKLHPMQEAFILYGAVQCGFCIPGQIMAASTLLERKPRPTEAEIKHALKDTLCRCGGYPTILRAVRAAGEAIASGGPVQGPSSLSQAEHRVVGTSVVRPDAEAKVTGEARFTDDYRFADMLYGRVLRARIPHARLKELHVERARSLEGVRAVVTAADIQGARRHGLVTRDWPVLIDVGEKARYVGDAVALVAADSPRQAERALAEMRVVWESLPVVSDPIQAHAADAEAVHDGGNLLKHIKVRGGDVEQGFARSEVTVTAEVHTPFTEHAFLEPECSIARPTSDGRMEVYVGSQIPYADREQIANCLGWPHDRVRVIGTLIGGGFGGKEDIAGQIHAALLAGATGQPVKVLFDRAESLLVHPKRHATQIQVRLGAGADGVLLAAETLLYGDTGAYASLGEKVMARATTHSTGPYIIPNVKSDCYAMYTNNPPAGAFRGFGVTQSCFAVETAIDALAHRLGMSPFAIRKLNALRVGATTNTGQVLKDSVGLQECLERLEGEMLQFTSGEDPFVAVEDEGKPGVKNAWGIAAAFKNTGLGGGAPDRAAAEVELREDGSAEVRTSSAEIGQGLVTVLAMIAAEELGLPVERVGVLLSDTDRTPDGGPTTASRQTYVTGNAVRNAAQVLMQALTSTVAEKFDCPPEQVRFVEGLAQISDHGISMGEAVAMMKAEGREAQTLYEYWAPATKPLGQGGDMHFAYSFAAQGAQVEVDLATGEVRVLRIIAAHDVGKSINPLGLLGQIEGGVVMGLGNALTEEFIVEDGRIYSDRLARYRMPSITHTPEIIPVVVEHPTADGPYGAKGIGEIGSIPTTPAITNAVYNACGVRVKRLPIDQDWLAREIVACMQR